MKAVIKSTVMALAIVGQLAAAKEFSPEALRALIDRAQAMTSQGRQSVVMFDLDDTLTNTRERNLRILRDFAAQADIQSAFPAEAAKIGDLTVDQIHFLLTDTLNGLGIANADFAKQANDFWLNHFFTNEYCAMDKPTPGAAKYLHLLVRAGAKIVYLTGRDTPRMGDGTKANLLRNRFPSDSDSSLLIMKPDAKIDDLEFKKSQFASIAAMGEVIGAFENEPANINAMADAFPDAAAIFLDTIHSPKPIVPEDRVQWVKDFRLN